MIFFILLAFSLQKVPILEGEELKTFLQNSHRSIVFFLAGQLHVEDNGFDILQFTNKIDIIESTKEEGMLYNCTAFPCIIPFADGVSLKGAYPFQHGSFSEWLRYIISIDTIQINNSVQAETLLQGNGSYIFAVDYFSRPITAPSDKTIYLVPSNLLHGAVFKGIYNYDTALKTFTPIIYEKPDIIEPEKLRYDTDFLAGYMVHKYDANDGLLHSILTDLSHKLKHNITFTMMTGEPAKLFKRNARLELFKCPYFFVFDIKSKPLRRWIIRGPEMLNSTYLHQTIKRIRQREIPPTLISEPVPQESSVVLYRHLVASNFQKSILDEQNRDSVVLFLTPWAQRCPKYQFVLRRIATLLKDTQVRVFWFDATQNDLPDSVPNIFGFPTVCMWPAGKKDQQPAMYTGKCTIQTIMKFIHEHASKTFVIPDSEYIETRLIDENL